MQLAFVDHLEQYTLFRDEHKNSTNKIVDAEKCNPVHRQHNVSNHDTCTLRGRILLDMKDCNTEETGSRSDIANVHSDPWSVVCLHRQHGQNEEHHAAESARYSRVPLISGDDGHVLRIGWKC